MDESVQKEIEQIFNVYDGMILGGNDFLYTKDLQSHPCSYFLYVYGQFLKEKGVDTIFLENHYIKELLQTRGLIGHVMYCAYLYQMRVIGIEGKFTNEEYKVHTGRDMKQIHNMDLDLKTIAYGTKQRVDRLNLITRDIVKYYKQGKYLLFCGMSHVNDETEITECKGMKHLMNAAGMGATFSSINKITPSKPFVQMGYKRDTDYLLEIKLEESIDHHLYIQSLVFCILHDYLFFYKTYRLIRNHVKLPYSISLLWNYDGQSVFPDKYKDYVLYMIGIDPQLYITDSEINELCSLIHYEISSLFKKIDTYPTRIEISSALSFKEDDESKVENDLVKVVDLWHNWVKQISQKNKLDKKLLDLLSDLVFLEYKMLSTDRNEVRYIKYLKNKFVKQLNRPEHKLVNIFRLLSSVHIQIPNPSEPIKKMLTLFH